MLFVFSELFQLIYQYFKRNSRIVGLAGMMVLGYLSGAVSLFHNSDYQTYEQIYENPMTQGNYFEHGYNIVSQYFYYHNWTYANFRMFICCVSFVILFLGVSRFTKNVALFSATYGVTIFFIDATQIRNLMMIALVTLGLSFLKKFNFKNLLIAGFLVWLSTEFQSLGYIYFLTLILVVIFETIFKSTQRTYIEFFFPLSLLAILIFFIAGISKLNSLLVKLAGVIGGRGNLIEKISGQYTYGVGGQKLFLIMLATFLGLLVIYQIFVLCVKSSSLEEFNKIRILYLAVVTSVMCLPLLFMAIDYSRLQRTSFIFMMIGVAIFSENSHRNSRADRITTWILVLVAVLIYGIVHNYTWGGLYTQTIPYLIQFVK
ncbi:EpsG family protein [Lactiplantibacillus plantarum]|uniref:EpsG family protein n=1 Tax=Lactiplantibacillus plantarum TaxID=1590 RepID=UPI002E2D8BBC|nr:EpsG family protein [Lactiplantibacillus plantarum]